MIKKITSIVFSILLFQSCQKKDSNNIENNSSIKTNPMIKVANSSDSNEKIQIDLVKNFMKWYLHNMNTLYKFNTIDGGPSTANENEDPENYFVNFSEVEKYITELKKSDFLTDNFIKNEKQIFVEGDKYFKENPQNDGPPYGFDYDHFFFTQDAFEEDLPNIEKAKYTISQKDSFNSEVKFHLPICGMNYKYSLKKIELKWLIEKIETE